MKKFFALFILILGFLPLTAQASSRVEIILDVSGSMGALAGGEKKIDAAKKAIATTVDSIPDGSVVALRLYGHRVPNQKKAESCQDSQLVIPFGPINKTQFKAALDKAMPLGQTPIAYSLQEAASDFGPSKDEEAVIILVSDGAETCGGDPVAVAKELIAKGFKVKINTIGFDVDPATRAQLEAISKTTGGTYQDAKDTAALSQSLKKITQESLVIEKEKSVYGQEIRGGDSYETAVPLTSGELYRLDHHQKKDDFDYFYIDLKGGQKLVAFIRTGEKGVEINQAGTAKENTNPYAGIQIHNKEKQKVKADTIIGSQNRKTTLDVATSMGQDGRYYILIGNGYDPQHKDNPFKVEVIDQFDAGTQRDAGENEASAIEIQPGTHTNYLHTGDQVDMFKIQTTPGTKYDFKARPNQPMFMRIKLFDSDGVELAKADAPNEGAATKIEGFSTPKGGEVFIRMSSYYSSFPATEYKLTIAKAGGEAAVEPKSPAQEAPAQPAAAPIAKAPSTSTPKETHRENSHSLTSVQRCEEVHLLVKGLPFLQKLKYYALYSGIPLLVGWLIGMIWGYIKGRKTGKRKALEQK